MRDTVHVIDNFKMTDPVVICLVQADVVAKKDQDRFVKYDFTNHSFSLVKFKHTLQTFHDSRGHFIIFPEFYLPLKYLRKAYHYVVNSNQTNKIYIIPLSHLKVSQFNGIRGTYRIISESVPPANKKDTYVNAALVFIIDNQGSVTLYAQLKALPALLETKQYMNLYNGQSINVWNVVDCFNFSILICYDLINRLNH